MDGITIREARPDDCTHLLDLWQLVSSGSPITDTVEHLRMIIDRNGELLLVAEMQGQIVGTVLGGWDLCGVATSIGWPFIQSEDIVELRAPSYGKSRSGSVKRGRDGFMHSRIAKKG